MKSYKECKKTVSQGEKLLSKCVNDMFASCNLKEDYGAKAECEAWEKSKCKKLVNTPLNEAFESCKDIPNKFLEGEVNVYGLSIRAFLDTTITAENFKCSKDEDGNMCPFMEYYMNQKLDADYSGLSEKEIKKIEDEDEKLAVKAVNETCRSKKCTEIYIAAHETYKKFVDEDVKSAVFHNENLHKKRELILDPKLTDDEKLEKILKYLRSDECVAQHGTNSEAKKEDKPSSSAADKPSSSDADTKKTKARKCIVKH